MSVVNRRLNIIAGAVVLAVCAWYGWSSLHLRHLRQTEAAAAQAAEAAKLRERAERIAKAPKLASHPTLHVEPEGSMSQGPTPCLAASDQGGSGGIWSTSADGSSAATATGAGSGPTPITNVCRFTMGANQFHLGAECVGVLVEISWSVGNAFTTPDATDILIQLTSGGSQLGTQNKALNSQLPTVDSVTSYGGALDAWGVPGIPSADVNAADFGVDIQCQTGSPDDLITITSVNITVYDASASGGEAPGAKVSASLEFIGPDGGAGNSSGGGGSGVIFRAGFAATPVPTPLNPICQVVAEPHGTAPTLAELLAGGWSYSHGFLEAPAPALPVATLAGDPDQDFWPKLLAGDIVSRWQLPYDALPGPQPYTVQAVGFAPGLGVPFEAVSGGYHYARGYLSPPPSVPQYVVAWPQDAHLPAGQLGGSLVAIYQQQQPATPTFCPPPAHIAAMAPDAAIFPKLAGDVLAARGFAEALPVVAPPPVLAGWPQGVEFEQSAWGEAIHAAGFADAFPALPRYPVIVEQTDQGAAVLSGAVVRFHTDVTPQPAPPQAARVSSDPTPLEILPAGSSIYARGFAGAQPDSPIAAVITTASLSSELFEQFAGDMLFASGFATGRLPPAPPVYVADSAPPAVDWLSGHAATARGTIQTFDVTPARTVYVAAIDQAALQPVGDLIHFAGFAEGQPTAPPRGLLAAPPEVTLAQSLLNDGAALFQRGFAEGLVSPAPPLYVAASEPPALEYLGGRSIDSRGFAPAHSANHAPLYVVASELPPLGLIGGDVRESHGAALPPDFEPAQTAYVVMRRGDELLQPTGDVIHARGFRGAGPVPPVASLVVDQADQQAALLGGAVFSARGFALALPDAMPSVAVCQAEPMQTSWLAGAVEFVRAVIEPDVPSSAVRPCVAVQVELDPAWLDGRAYHAAPRIAPAASLSPRPFVPLAGDDGAVAGVCVGAVVYNFRASLLAPRDCVC